MRKCRLFFTKLGKIKYTSHLDLMRVFRRAFNRAELSVKHSEGFNPHPIMSIVLPLPTGQESICEMLDVTFEDEIGSFLQLPGRINPALPDGICVERAQVPILKPGDISFVRSQMEFDTALQEITEIPEQLIIRKTTKSGNVREIIQPGSSFTQKGISTLECLLPPDVNPLLAASALGADFCRVRRLEVLANNGRSFE